MHWSTATRWVVISGVSCSTYSHKSFCPSKRHDLRTECQLLKSNVTQHSWEDQTSWHFQQWMEIDNSAQQVMLKLFKAWDDDYDIHFHSLFEQSSNGIITQLCTLIVQTWKEWAVFKIDSIVGRFYQNCDSVKWCSVINNRSSWQY